MRFALLIGIVAGLLLTVPVALAAPAMRTDVVIGGAAEAAGEPLPLWPPHRVPGERGSPGATRIVERSADALRPDRYADQIDAPYLMVHAPARSNGRALLVIPGGGYQRVVIDKEGSELVPGWVDEAGYTLFVLRYRLPQAGRPVQAALADAQRALRLIRSQAAARGLDAETIAVMGFSAGGHVAARLATGYALDTYPPQDAIDRLSARPWRVVLGYPVIDMGAQAHAGSRQRLLGEHPDAGQVAQFSLQRQVHADMPPVLLLHAADDEVVTVDNSLLMAQALAAAGVEHELHVFAHGGHGFGMRTAAGSTTALWPQLAQRFLQATQENQP